MKKKAFIEIKVLRMETINPSFSDGSGVFWERVITTLLLIIDQKALKNKVIADADQMVSIDKYFLSLNLGSRSFWRYYLWKNISI